MNSQNSFQILVVEDDAPVRNLITTTLKTHGYRYRIAENGQSAIMQTASYSPDALLLDLGLPDLDGIEVIRRVRTWSEVPIIIISARSEDADKIEALDAGADDYLTKPFSVEELLARLRVTQRRLGRQSESARSPVYQNGALRIDYPSGRVYLDGKEIHLTSTEYRLLILLAQNTDKVLTHNLILQKVWGARWEGDAGTLRVFMATLRRKLEPTPDSPRLIQTYIGIGYRMLRQPPAEASEQP